MPLSVVLQKKIRRDRECPSLAEGMNMLIFFYQIFKVDIFKVNMSQFFV